MQRPAVPPRSSTQAIERGVLTGAAQSLAASVLPLALGLLALPVLTRALGAERIALLALAWAWLGVAQLLDLGLGRALVRRFAEADARGTLDDEAGAVVAGESILLRLGLAVGVLGAVAGTWYVRRGLALPAALLDDATLAALCFCAAVPPTAAAAAPRAVLEATRRFRTVSAVRLVVNAATFAVPLVLLPVTLALWPTALALLAVRCWAWWRLRRAARTVLGDAAPTRVPVAALLRDGAWITVSNVLGPVMTSLDRFLIGLVVGTAAVAHYAVPYEAITKAWIVPGAICTALFPSAAFVRARAGDALPALHALAVRATAALVLPAMALAVVAAPQVIALLAGRDWPEASARVLAWLAVGTALNSLAMVPYVLLQAAGRARAVALLHLAEVVPYLVALAVGLRVAGIEGAAIAWTARVAVDTTALAAMAARHAPAVRGTWLRLVAPIALLVAAAAALLARVPLAPWAGAALVAAVAAATLPVEALRALRLRVAGAS
jgi:O-antigen/teichoic acid export membrane protein